MKSDDADDAALVASPAAELHARGLRYVSLVMFLDALAASLGISVLPYLVTSLGGSPTEFGSMLATFAFANVMASLWIGTASDKLGRRALLTISLFGMSAGFLTNGLATSVRVLFAARATIGFFAGLGSTGRAYIADICTKDERASAMAHVGGLMMLGYAAGPPLGAALVIIGDKAAPSQDGVNGMRVPFLVGGLSCWAAATVVAFRLPSAASIQEASAAKGNEDPKSGDPTADGRAAGGMSFRSGAVLGLLLLTNFLAQAPAACFFVAVPLWIEATFRWGPTQFSCLMTAFVLCMAVTQMAVFPKLNQLFGLFPLGVVSYLAAGASYTGYVIINDNTWADMSIWFAFWLVGVLAGGAGGPVINVAVADFGGPGNMGMVMSLASTAEQCGRVAAPLLISYSYDQISSDAAFLVGGATLWLSAGALACVALVHRQQGRDEEARAPPKAEGGGEADGDALAARRRMLIRQTSSNLSTVMQASSRELVA